MELNDDNKNLYSSENMNDNYVGQVPTHSNGVPNYNSDIYAQPTPTPTQFSSGVNYGAINNPAPAPMANTNQYNGQPVVNNGPVNRNFNPNENVSLGEWVATLLLMCIPCAGTILLFVWAFSSTEKVSKRTFAQAALILKAVGIVLGIIGMATSVSAVLALIGELF